MNNIKLYLVSFVIKKTFFRRVITLIAKVALKFA